MLGVLKNHLYLSLGGGDDWILVLSPDESEKLRQFCNQNMQLNSHVECDVLADLSFARTFAGTSWTSTLA